MGGTIHSYQQAGWSGLIASGWEDTFADLDAWQSAHAGTTVVNQPTRQVRRVETPQGVLYVKVVSTLVEDHRVTLKNLWKHVKWYCGPSRFMRTMRITAAMEEAGIGCPPSILAAVRRQGLRKTEILVNQEVPYPCVSALLAHEDEGERRVLLERVLGELCRFHQAGFIHGDCIPGNVLWDGAKAYFFDNDRTVRKQPQRAHWRMEVERNLQQFGMHAALSLGNMDWGDFCLETYRSKTEVSLDYEDLHKRIFASVRRKLKQREKEGRGLKTPAGLDD